MPFALDYDKLVHLDAEDLAETGVREAYDRLLPELRKYVPNPAPIEEQIDSDTPRYAVRCAGTEYVISSPQLGEENGGSWCRATVAFFEIVNRQLVGSAYRFYAINGGNDLGGMFLTPEQAIQARDALPNRRDWPYLPTSEPPWYGEYH